MSTEAVSDFVPTETIDLGTLITEDLPERMWGRAFMRQMNFVRGHGFDVIRWTAPVEGGTVAGSNAYYTLFNHGGPHVDAPCHMGFDRGIDGYPIDVFSGPAKVFDVRGCGPGRTVPAEVFQGRVERGDVVLVLTGYVPPHTDDTFPRATTLTNDAAEYLASLPIRAYGTDAFGVDALEDGRLPLIHQSLLSRGIPVYEQLCNLDRLLARHRLFFVGVPLNIRGGDGMLVRPVVFVY